METDEQFEDYTVEKVEGNNEDGWVLHFREGTCFLCPKESPIEPRPGMKARLFGKGFGCVVRGLSLDGVSVYYRTEDEDRIKHEEEVAERKRQRREEFEQDRENRDARFAALPEIFRKRIEKFRRNNPEFRWEYEPYEMFCCEEAVVIANALRSPEAVKDFAGKQYEEQKALVPNLGEGHSGNTFGCTVRLAYLYLSDAEAVEKMYGALAPLVGSEEYGCVAKGEA